jgi:hypothetical protein
VFWTILQLRSIRRSLPLTVFKSVVAALVNGSLDYCNSVLAGLPVYLLHRLQSVQNAAARLIFRLGRSDHISDKLIELHWLRIRERIDYKLATLVYRCHHGTAPPYLAQMFTLSSGVSARRHLRSFSAAIACGSDLLCVPTFRLVTVGGRVFDIVGASVWNSVPADKVIHYFCGYHFRLP